MLNDREIPSYTDDNTLDVLKSDTEKVFSNLREVCNKLFQWF